MLCYTDYDIGLPGGGGSSPQKKMHIILRDVLKWHGCGGPSVAV